MTLPEFNRFCRSLPHTTHVVQWGDAEVWKVGAKVFAIARWQADEKELHVTFKVSELGYEIMKELPGLRPAPYLASRGLKWIQRFGPGSLSDRELKDVLREAHALIAAGLTKKARRELGLDPAPETKPPPRAKPKSRQKSSSPHAR